MSSHVTLRVERAIIEASLLLPPALQALTARQDIESKTIEALITVNNNLVILRDWLDHRSIPGQRQSSSKGQL